MVSTDSPRSGSSCLYYQNTDPANYKLCMTTIAVEPGRRYLLEGWVRTQDVTGSESGAAICVEWYNSLGGLISGCYPPGLKGTNSSWRNISVITNVMPATAVTARVFCFLRPGMIGAAWWDDISLSLYRDPLVQGVTTDHYRGETAGDNVTVKFGINREQYDLSPGNVTLSVNIKNSSGQIIQTFPARETSPLATNSGFEQVDGNGWAAGWGRTGVNYTISTDMPHGGIRSLYYQNTDPASYKLCINSVTLEAGKRYALTGRIRTSNVSSGNATICVEWYNSQGGYLGGTYSAGFTGTNSAWQQLYAITPVLPSGTTAGKFICYLTSGATGSAWWDDLALAPYPDQFINTATATFNSASLPAGDYTVECVASGGAFQGSDTCRLKRVSSSTSRAVYIDNYRRMILNGQPFFPLGTYWRTFSESDLDTYAASSFNCLTSPAMLSITQLDQINAYNFKVIYTLKDCYYGTPYCPSAIQAEADEYPYIQQQVAVKGNHPALIGWYNYDETPLNDVNRLKNHQQWLENLDPGHPTWGNTNLPTFIGRFLNASDILSTDPYPVLNQVAPAPAYQALQWAQSAANSVRGCKAVWMVPQIFNWQVYYGGNYRPPTLQEMRSMAWQSIASGANGLLFYSFTDLKNDPDATFAARWSDVKTMASEISSFFPVLLSAETVPGIPRVRSPADTVAWRLYNYQGKTYIVVASGGADSSSAVFQFPTAFQQIAVLLGNNDVSLNGGVTAVVPLAPLEVKVICLTPQE
ncbi:MAG: hypothetical protein WCV67_19180 [Victivallaceae bacterium]